MCLHIMDCVEQIRQRKVLNSEKSLSNFPMMLAPTTECSLTLQRAKDTRGDLMYCSEKESPALEKLNK